MPPRMPILIVGTYFPPILVNTLVTTRANYLFGPAGDLIETLIFQFAT